MSLRNKGIVFPPNRNCCENSCCNPTPNDFSGTDSERIAKAVAKASRTTGIVEIPQRNKRGGDVWLIDYAILLPSNITVILDNSTIKLSDKCRDNFFRSANCGLGITSFVTYENINIVGIGTATLEGANNPRATGDTGKTLSLTPGSNQSYGSDAGKVGEYQKGDWRNFSILLAYVNGFIIDNITIKNPHMWAITLERCSNGRITNIHNNHNGFIFVDGVQKICNNQDAIDLRYGCNNIIIDNITGQTGDDCVSLNAIQMTESPGIIGTITCTGCGDIIPTDDIKYITIKNVICFSNNQLVRILNTGNNYKITDIVIDTVTDNSGTNDNADAAIIIGDTGYGGVAPLGNTSRIIINNVISRASRTIYVVGSLSESIITNVIRYEAVISPGTVIFYNNMAYIRNVNTSNIFDYTI